MTVRKKRRRTSAVVRRSTSVRRAPAKRRTRRKSLSDGGGKFSIQKTINTTMGGALGGAVYTAPKFFMKLPLLGKIAVGLGASIGFNFLGMPNAGAGATGAMVADLASTSFATQLKDEYLEDTEYVDADTLSDTGMCDENGEAIVMDDDGVCYALNDDGEYQAVGMANDFSLQDPNIRQQSVSMIPLQDAYSLQNPYDLM